VSGFQCWFDRFGDLFCANGVVVQPRTGVRIAVGTGGGFTAQGSSRGEADFVTAKQAQGATFVGGSGRNLISSGALSGLSTGEKPVGFFRPLAVGKWKAGVFVLEVLGASSATISDGVDVVAEMTTGTTPAGDYVATTYGEDTYNGGTTFTLTVTAEAGTSVGIPDAVAVITAGTAQGGTFVATDEATWVHDTDSDWTIVTAADGSAELRYLTDVIAERATGNPNDPAGPYEATTLGRTYNLTDAEPVDGEPWTAAVTLTGKVPQVGYVYLHIVEATGTLDEVNGPFFATSMPAPTTDNYYFQLAYSDGAAVEQDHTGAVVWP
jgi:hypothetical protein